MHAEIPGFQDARKSKEGTLCASVLLLHYLGAKHTPLWLENFTTATQAGWLRVSRYMEGRRSVSSSLDSLEWLPLPGAAVSEGA